MKTAKNVFNRLLHYTEKIFYWLVICYFIWQFASLALIVWGIKETMQFSFLDTFITETNETFRTVAGAVIVKFLIENIFKYNEFSFSKHKTERGNDDTRPIDTETDQPEVLDGSSGVSG